MPCNECEHCREQQNARLRRAFDALSAELCNGADWSPPAGVHDAEAFRWLMIGAYKLKCALAMAMEGHKEPNEVGRVKEATAAQLGYMGLYSPPPVAEAD